MITTVNYNNRINVSTIFPPDFYNGRAFITVEIPPEFHQGCEPGSADKQVVNI